MIPQHRSGMSAEELKLHRKVSMLVHELHTQKSELSLLREDFIRNRGKSSSSRARSDSQFRPGLDERPMDFDALAELRASLRQLQMQDDALQAERDDLLERLQEFEAQVSGSGLGGREVC